MYVSLDQWQAWQHHTTLIRKATRQGGFRIHTSCLYPLHAPPNCLLPPGPPPVTALTGGREAAAAEASIRRLKPITLAPSCRRPRLTIGCDLNRIAGLSQSRSRRAAEVRPPCRPKAAHDVPADSKAGGGIGSVGMRRGREVVGDADWAGGERPSVRVLGRGRGTS